MARSSNMMKVLLTGASGFAGSHMLKELIDTSHSEVICPVTYRHGGNSKRIPALLEGKDTALYKICDLDLANEKSIEKILSFDFDTIINFASESHVDRSIKKPLKFFHNNIDLMVNLLEIARIKEIKNFIHISTDEVYGSLPTGSINKEWQYPHRPSNPYSASKSAQESLAMSYCKTFNIPITIINSTNLIGEAQNQEKFLPKIISSIILKEVIYVDTDNEKRMGSRKYLYAGDLAKAVIKVINSKSLVEDFPRKFHISGSEEYSNLDVVNLVGGLLGIDPRIQIRISPRPGYDLRYELNSDRLKSLGWEESDVIKNHIAKILNWTLSNPDWLTIDYH